MDEESIIQYIVTTFEDVQTETSTGNTFFFYGPDHRFSFATLVTNDEYDQVSDLNRPSVFRLNLGISKQTFRDLFGPKMVSANSEGTDESIEPTYDFAVLNQLMPHPVYGKMYWVSILNPDDDTFATVVRPLISEAYEIDVAKKAKRA